MLLLKIILVFGFIKGGALQCSPPCVEDEICDNSMQACLCDPALIESPALPALLLRPQLICMPQGFMLTLSRCLAIKLLGRGLESPNSTCMVNFTDTGPLNGIQATFLYAPWNPNCDALFSVDDNFSMYTTSILFQATDINGVYVSKDVVVNYTCSYPLNMQVSLDMSVNPVTSTNYITISGSGKYPITMALYKYSNYTGVYTTADLPIQIKVEDIMYIGGMVEGVDTAKFALEVETCYFTPTSDFNDTNRYDLIVGSCPVGNGVSIIENGVSSQTQIKARVVKFASSDQLFVHCSFKLCSIGSCAQVSATVLHTFNQRIE
ncbi:pancreatic secretory granule membrane major glycoprotein GP2-like isoform X2 [Protopterus annectens]|uniref:pancreatic secretory granule membrane major glycoprotein GP2-like isoform X2 n=1 Tax=Protopterus annectens TaxID=7888 RepID=UPI001CFA52D0|nr:pancreatic secretory granule membrane major glycoprotein GP2-like isoform X2 [Protopterus annectens]